MEIKICRNGNENRIEITVRLTHGLNLTYSLLSLKQITKRAHIKCHAGNVYSMYWLGLAGKWCQCMEN